MNQSKHEKSNCRNANPVKSNPAKSNCENADSAKSNCENADSAKIPYYSLNSYLKNTFGCKVYKIALDGGFTCPNRDGTIDTRGCIFCSEGGSGDFAQNRGLSITDQIEAGKGTILSKMPTDGSGKYIAYLQAYTNTYGPTERLRRIYEEALQHPDIVALSIGTRPDCLPEETADLIKELADAYRKPIWVELGLQTIHEKSACYIRRGYPLSVYDTAVSLLRDRQIPIITHVILGLPQESREEMLETVDYVGRSGSAGIKLQLLHVLKGTDLAADYEAGTFRVMDEEEYCLLVRDCIALLPPDMVIHRMTGDGDKKQLLAPAWSANKKQVLNHLHRYLAPAYVRDCGELHGRG